MIINSYCVCFYYINTGTNHVYSWGNGTSGQLGNGTCVTTIKPTLVPMTLDGKVQGMSCGARHSFIWTVNGYCYSFGNNFNAQLGYNFSKADFKENQVSNQDYFLIEIVFWKRII
jgi:alpha-tubulin suppressor-like RCC1 family protein